MPFGENVQHKEDIKSCVVKDPLVFRPSDEISPVTRALLEGLLAKRPRDRLTMAEIKVHPYFHDV
jgi:serine/threonine protein kinase